MWKNVLRLLRLRARTSPVGSPLVDECEMETSHSPQEDVPQSGCLESNQVDEELNEEASLSDCDTLTGEPSPLIYPTLPTKTERYKLARTMDDKPISYEIKPLRTDYTRKGLPANWVPCIHPEGLKYFYLPATDAQPMRVLTDAWLYDSEIANQVEDFLQSIQNFILERSISIPPGSDLVLELVYEKDETGEGQYWCGYYFVHHPRKVLFWLEKFELYSVSDPLREIRGEIFSSHIGSCLEVEYWAYWDTYPNVQDCTQEIYDYICDVIISAMTDVTSCDDSTVTQPYEKLRNMLEIVRAGKKCKTSNWHIGRFMRSLVQDRFRNYHGQWASRLSRTQSVFRLPDEPNKPSRLLRILSPLLFCAPDQQLTNLEALWVDRLTVRIHWNKLFEELTNEWSQTTALATFLLTANGAFLAMPLFDSRDKSDPHSSLAQVMSYLSLLTSLSSIIIGLVMYRQHHKKSRGAVKEILNYLSKHQTSNSAHELAHLALLFSLPYALLMWSMVTFLAAFLVMCFDGTAFGTKIAIGCASAFNLSLIAWCIYRFWDREPNRWQYQWLQLWSKLRRWFPRGSGKKHEGEESGESSQTEDSGGDSMSVTSCRRRFSVVESIKRGGRVVRTGFRGLGGSSRNNGDAKARRADVEQMT